MPARRRRVDSTEPKTTDVDESSGGRRPGGVTLDLRTAGTSLHLHMGAAAVRRIGVTVDAGSGEWRTVDVAQNTSVVTFVRRVVEMRRGRKRQQRERG